MSPLPEGSLPSEVEVYAETIIEVIAGKTWKWEDFGIRLNLSFRAIANFSIKVVWSSRFELPKGTELVSPVYWVSHKGKVGGQVGVELQHCARVMQDGEKSGLSFIVCKVENAEPHYHFELCKGQFSSRSSFGSVELEFRSMFVAIVRSVMGKQPTSDPVFQAKVYYQQNQPEYTTVHIVVVPKLDISTKVGGLAV